jgi:hypothetical protein
MQDQQHHLIDVAEQADLKIWNLAEYEAGHAARLGGLALSKCHTICWRMGWQDADILFMQDASAHEVPDRSFLDSTPPQLWSLYALGRIARANGLPFGVDSPEAWKYGWVQMDIDLGVSNPQNPAELILFRGTRRLLLERKAENGDDDMPDQGPT